MARPTTAAPSMKSISGDMVSPSGAGTWRADVCHGAAVAPRRKHSGAGGSSDDLAQLEDRHVDRDHDAPDDYGQYDHDHWLGQAGGRICGFVGFAFGVVG